MIAAALLILAAVYYLVPNTATLALVVVASVGTIAWSAVECVRSYRRYRAVMREIDAL